MLRNRVGFLLLIVVFCSAAFAQGISRDSRNVEKLYKDVVAQQGLPLFSSDWNENAKIEIRDTKNGYLKITGAIDGWLEVALFRKKNRDPLLVIGVTGCGPACGTELHAFEFQKGKAIDVSKAVFEKFQGEEVERKLSRRFGKQEEYVGDILEILPRKGTTIKTVFEDESDVLYEFAWKNDKFELVRNVLDYYSIFPGNALHSKSTRGAKIMVNDSKNGYVKIKLRSSSVETALFRMSDGTPVMFVVENYCGTGRCATAEFEVRKFVENKWIDVTETIMPELAEKQIHAKSAYAAKYGYQFKMPRKGRTVKIVEGDAGKTIYNLMWKNDKFVVK